MGKERRSQTTKRKMSNHPEVSNIIPAPDNIIQHQPLGSQQYYPGTQTTLLNIIKEINHQETTLLNIIKEINHQETKKNTELQGNEKKLSTTRKSATLLSTQTTLLRANPDNYYETPTREGQRKTEEETDKHTE